MKTPGITVNPVYILGGIHSVNEVELKDVRVPVENLVGEENKGWTYAKGLLTHERTGIAGVAERSAAGALEAHCPGDGHGRRFPLGRSGLPHASHGA